MPATGAGMTPIFFTSPFAGHDKAVIHPNHGQILKWLAAKLPAAIMQGTITRIKEKVSETDAGRSWSRGLLGRLRLPGFCGRTSRLLNGRRLPRFARRRCGRWRGRCGAFVVQRGRAVRYGGRLLSRRHAKIIGGPLKITDEIVGGVDFDDRVVATLPKIFYGFLGRVHLVINVALADAEAPLAPFGLS